MTKLRPRNRPYTLYYVSNDWPDTATWSVWRERYADFDANDTIPGSSTFVSRHPSSDEAYAEAGRLQASLHRLVPVVSFVYYSGDRVGPDLTSFGGHDWFYTLADAEGAYEQELHANSLNDQAVHVRLVCVQVPQYRDGQKLTDYLDADIDRIEHRLPARREANVGGIYREDQDTTTMFRVAGQTFATWNDAQDYATFLREQGTEARVVEVSA